jgi:eukaryotic-like serine/threonine-protein kinase
VTIAIGQILDKYELLEKVGQGGMAVVYRGMDRTLGRLVAIKVLHEHLADYQEARDRFEREARAVAKLRHENILEIFDFSGKSAAGSYIVTEFIDGQTLKEFTTDHCIKYPEIGAMIAVQVCRALGHAHSAGILHRDVKPENIMIRNDGVVKLTDFGIAQMLDMQRMTVTGQLLGSPAYMSPEHVEGGQLDFRTDVFAVGVVLYQLVVGELPFHGKNPHEILKRIADCVYQDPQKANPLVGRDLGRIIQRALARNPDHRYADITEMLMALESYLAASGLSDCRKELARFFEAPVAYEVALRQRLLAHLCRRGHELMHSDRVAALEHFNRVLTIDPDHAQVLATLDTLSRRRRGMRALALCGAGLVIGVIASLLVARMGHDPEAAAWSPHASLDVDEDSVAEPRETPRLLTDMPIDIDGPANVAAEAGGDAGPADARAALAGSHAAQQSERDDPRVKVQRDPGDTKASVDASASPAPQTRSFTLTVAPRKSEYRIDEGPWQPIDRSASISVGPGEHTVEVRNDACCQAASRTIAADAGDSAINVTLGYLPATITPKCDTPDVRVQIDGRPARLGNRVAIPITSTLGQPVKVTFIGESTDEHTLQLRYNEARDVTCKFD